MRQTTGDMWQTPADVRVVTTNGQCKQNGLAVMGKGVAQQAAQRYPQLADLLGNHLRMNGNHVAFFAPDIVTLPTKEHWRDPSPWSLVQRSLQELVALTNIQEWQQVVLPPPGCGLGGLQWSQIEADCQQLLDDRFLVVHYQPSTW